MSKLNNNTTTQTTSEALMDEIMSKQIELGIAPSEEMPHADVSEKDDDIKKIKSKIIKRCVAFGILCIAIFLPNTISLIKSFNKPNQIEFQTTIVEEIPMDVLSIDTSVENTTTQTEEISASNTTYVSMRIEILTNAGEVSMDFNLACDSNSSIEELFSNPEFVSSMKERFTTLSSSNYISEKSIKSLMVMVDMKTLVLDHAAFNVTDFDLTPNMSNVELNNVSESIIFYFDAR